MAVQEKDPIEILKAESKRIGVDFDSLPKKEQDQMVADFNKEASKLGMDSKNLSDKQVKELSKKYREGNDIGFFENLFGEPGKIADDAWDTAEDLFTDDNYVPVHGLNKGEKVIPPRVDPEKEGDLPFDGGGVALADGEGGGGSSWVPNDDERVRRTREDAEEKDGGGNRTDESSGGGSGTGGGEKIDSNPIEAAEDPMESLILGDSDLPALTGAYDHIRGLEDKRKFEFDDTYAPDNEGYRDIGGNLMDVGRGIAGAFGATEPLTDYKPSSDFNTMLDENRQRRDLGIDQETKSEFRDSSDRGYNYDVKNIRGMSGGSGGVALANLGGASDRYYGAQNNLAMLDQQVKGQNRGRFNQGALAGESVNRQIWQDQRDIDIANKTAGGALLGDSIDSIQQRREYEDTYKKPGSPYYEYMKEMTLGTRMNRELKQFGEEERMNRWEEMLLTDQNQLQEDIVKRERVRDTLKDEYKKKAGEQGMTTSPTTADEFNEYNGEPITDIGQGVNETEMFSSLNEPTEFGLTQNEMSGMSDEDLDEQGIKRVKKTQMKKNPDGSEHEISYFDYNKTEEIPDKPDVERELSNIEDDINREYSVKEKELMDEWYLKDEKEYNKRLKVLQEEKEGKVKTAKEEYQKK